VFVDFQLSVVYAMVTFLMVERALVTLTETVTILPDVGAYLSPAVVKEEERELWRQNR
jgi:hypothetical protein